MSRIFSKRSGFTLVEIIVAFAIFAIMAAMLVSLTGLAVKQRQSNYNLSKELSGQQQYLAAHERETEYEASEKGGSFVFNFDGSPSASLDYSVVHATDDETSESGITYFVADANYGTKPVGGGDDSGDDTPEGTGLGLAEKVDSRIYGSANFEYIRLRNMKKVTDPDVLTDRGVPAGSSMYTFEVCAVDNKAAQSKEDTRLARNFKMRFDCDVLDCGYYTFDGAGNPNSFKRYSSSFTTSDGKAITCDGKNRFEILLCSPDTVRVSVPHNIIEKHFKEGSYEEVWCFNGTSSYFYVILKEDKTLTEASFGEKYTTNVFDGVTEYYFKPTTAVVSVKDKDGNVTGTENLNLVNVYGAFEKGDTVLLDPPEEENP